ncbi:type II secretion system protein [Desulfatitalea alkaliphila]|uniref:Prepilin-type N-terminal cleavage/methylation domain-containing protein n=1 Tax=Desulfatitalea alkaliphila TaxID=2929485 RepID=A0AA41R727_9BACT|nr:prepilin-type N-terminal cleavage/methylation domain-containing protein [Desulfatitalea alkaliphila]MCJ8502136.1 prepilin-type N-terminal cleavage/methylation domain-containing protein [Desulfatitalea alkaliphila]
MVAYKPHLADRSGFTLIEMAVVLVVVGIIISIVASVLPSLISTSRIRQARAELEKVDLALIGYLTANGRLPCPDSNGDGQEDRIAGSAPPTDDSCAAYAGRLPYATLGLSSALDPWQEPIRYAVYEDMVRTRHDTLCAAPPCTLCLNDFINNPVAEHLSTSDGTHQNNQAYLIVSGGAKNLSGSGGFFDGRNADGDLVFETPNRTIDATYDDIVRAVSFTYLVGRLCSGNMGGNNPWAGCVDEFGVVDCDRPECAGHPACLGGEDLRIITTVLPGGRVGGSYATDLTATGGNTPYEWQLTNGGGFFDMAIDPYTGMVSGTLDQCPGTYSIAALVQDTTAAEDDGPQTDSRTFSLEVSADLSVRCTSTPGSAITWASPAQQEHFRADGGRLGPVAWNLDTGGAAGFAVYPTGDDTCLLRKTGTTAPGVYTFTLAARDSACNNNNAALIFQVTVTAEGGATPGAIAGVVDRLRFSTFQSFTPDIVHMSGADYAIITRGWFNQGYVHAVDIAANGDIGTRDHFAVFESAATETPRIIRVDGDVYAIAYVSGGRARVRTVRITNGGQSVTQLSSLNLDNNWSQPVIRQVGGNLFAVACNGPGDNGRLAVLEISPDGQSITRRTAFSFSNTRGVVDLTHVTDNIFALAHHGNQDGYLTTIAIDENADVTLLDQQRFVQGGCNQPRIAAAGSGVFVLTYQGQNAQGVAATVTIAADGAITVPPLDTLVFETQQAADPVVVNAGGGVFAVAYTGPGNQGWFKTFLVDPSGAIGDEVLDSLVFETAVCREPAMIAMGNNLFVVVYRGPNNDRGEIVTIALQ